MRKPIPINLAVEDSLSEAVLRRLLKWSNRPYSIGATFNRSGYGYLKKTILGFNNAAKGTPFFVLTDLDQYPCPSALINDWLPVDKNHNLVFRVASKEVESWLIDHKKILLDFLRVGQATIPLDVDTINNPKEFIINLAKKSKSKEVRQDIVPPAGSLRKQGPNYNGRLIDFVHNVWNPDVASNSSPSLASAIRKIKTFKPIW